MPDPYRPLANSVILVGPVSSVAGAGFALRPKSLRDRLPHKLPQTTGRYGPIEPQQKEARH
jgi:hypothetical protein